MKTHDNKKITKASHQLLFIAWYIQLLLLGVIIILFFATMLGAFNNSTVTIPLPLKSDQICLDDSYIGFMEKEEAAISSISGGKVFIQSKMTVAKRIALFNYTKYVIWLCISLYITFLLKRVVKTIKDKNPFAPENSATIKTIGKVVMLITPISILLYQLDVSVFHKNFVMSFGTDFMTTVSYGIIPILLGAAFHVLADVFSKGSIIQEEQNLTV